MINVNVPEHADESTDRVYVLDSTGTLALIVWWVSQGQDLLGAHDPSNSPLDPLAIIVPGAHSRLGELTQPIWSKFAGNIHENTVHFGVFVWIVILWKARCPPAARCCGYSRKAGASD